MKFINIEHYYGNELENVILCEKEIEEYNKYFNSIKNQFSNAFNKQYINCHGFHDWFLISMEYNEPIGNKKPYLTITLFYKWKNKTKQIIYSGVQCFNSNFLRGHFIKDAYDTYGIDEFLKLDGNLFSHEVYFPSGSSYYVEFKTIRIK